jgi:recombination protein RecA
MEIMQESSKKEKLKQLNKVIKKITDKEAINIGFGMVNPVKYLETPFVTLNKLIGGGFPMGKFTTIAGAERTAKGTLLLQTIGYHMQKDPEFIALWTDAEESLDEEWCVRHGIDMSRMIVQRYSEDAPYFEKLLDNGIEMIKTGAVNIWVIDSVAALMPKSEEQKSIEENAMLDLQRKLPVFFRKAIRHMSLHDTATIMVGQIYEAPNTSYVDIRVKGGNGLKHWAHLRLMTRRGNKKEITAPDVEVVSPDGTMQKLKPGWPMHIKVDKTRINKNEGQSIVLQFLYGRGLDSVDATITALFANEIFQSSGAWFYHDLLPDGKVQGKANLINILKEDEDLRKTLLDELTELLKPKISESIFEDIETQTT